VKTVKTQTELDLTKYLKTAKLFFQHEIREEKK